eukprot:9139862-Pyramimonas_sp.AAC.1
MEGAAQGRGALDMDKKAPLGRDSYPCPVRLGFGEGSPRLHAAVDLDASLYQPGTYPYPYAGHLLITMPILGIPLLSEGASLRLPSPFG